MANYLKTTAISVSLFVCFGIVHAQTLFKDTVTITVNPTHPRAFEEISFEVKSVSLDLNRSELSWFVNGTLKTRGVGIKKFNTKSGALGTTDKILLSVKPIGERTVEKTISIKPTDVDIIWEAYTYTPPFYKGKALPSSESFIVVSAMPELFVSPSQKLSPNNLIYTWEKDGLILGDLSGFGKKHIVIEAKELARLDTVITVTVTSVNRALEGKQTIQIETRDPDIVFYEKTPLAGVNYDNAFQRDYELTKEEVTAYAEPYFFSRDDAAEGSLTYAWALNGEKIEPTGKKSQEMTLRESGSGGVAHLTVKIENTVKLLQEIVQGLFVSF